jgi:hypothetical protein
MSPEREIAITNVGACRGEIKKNIMITGICQIVAVCVGMPNNRKRRHLIRSRFWG